MGKCSKEINRKAEKMEGGSKVRPKDGRKKDGIYWQ